MTKASFTFAKIVCTYLGSDKNKTKQRIMFDELRSEILHPSSGDQFKLI